MNIDHATQKISHSEYAEKFWKRLEGRSYFPVYFPSKDSPLDWRDCLVFSALAYHARLAKSKATFAKLSEMTGIYRETVTKVVGKLQGLRLVDEDLRVIEPAEPGAFFVLKTRMPLDRSWTGKLVYSRYYLPDAEDTSHALQPLDAVLMALLVGRKSETTTVSYLATCLGCERKTVSASLVRLSGHGLAVDYGPQGITIDYGKFLPSPTLFHQARKAAKVRQAEGVVYPEFFVQAVEAGKIPASYLGRLAGWAKETNDKLFPYDWSHLIIDKCWQDHQSFKEKKGVPYPSLDFIRERALSLYNKKSQYVTR